MTPTRRRLVVGVNPAASFGTGAGAGAVVQRMLEAAGHEVAVVQRESMAALQGALADALLAGPDAVVVVGGDGMVHLGANLLAETDIPLGIVPTGTGNDMARGLGIPIDHIPAAVNALLAALAEEPRAVDLGRITDAGGKLRWFAGVLSAGFDAVVNDRANRMRWPRGASRYTVAMLLELVRFRPISYTIEVDGARMHRRAMLVAVANGSSIGGGMRITPDARLDDAELDLFLVAPLSKLAFIGIFPRVFSGTHVSHSAVTIRRGRRFRLEADNVVAFADGEPVGNLPLEIDVVPGCLRVLVPTAVGAAP